MGNMLIHITPRLLKPSSVGLTCGLIDVEVPELGLMLKEGRELVARTPYPNKRYLVASRKQGLKAIVGLFIDATSHIEAFTVITRWSVEGETLLTHRVHYVVLDHDHDAVTDSMVLWHATSKSLGGFTSRWPQVPKEWTAANAQPRMDVLKHKAEQGGRVGEVRDTVSPTGLIRERNETFRMPTVERARLLHPRLATQFGGDRVERLPNIESAFKVETPAELGAA